MTASAITTLPAIGTRLPAEGGTLAAILARPDGSIYGLIVPSAEHDVEGIWGKYGQKIEGARGAHGLASTQAMAEAGSDIAKAVLALQIDGHADWYIPARIELLAAYENVPHLFDKDDWYWSSTQYSSYDAWCQAFEYGSSDAYDKDNEFRARPVRSIQLQPFTPSALPEAAPAPIGEADPREISAAQATASAAA